MIDDLRLTIDDCELAIGIERLTPVKRWLRIIFFGSSPEVNGTFRHEVLRRVGLVVLLSVPWALGLTLQDEFFPNIIIASIHIDNHLVVLFCALQFAIVEGILRRSWRMGTMTFILIAVATLFSDSISRETPGALIFLLSLGGATGFCAGIASKTLLCLILAVFLGQVGGLISNSLHSYYQHNGPMPESIFSWCMIIDGTFTIFIALAVGLGIWAGTKLSQRWGTKNLNAANLPSGNAVTKGE